MKKYQGKSVSEGIAIGKLRVYSGEQRIIEKRRTEEQEKSLPAPLNSWTILILKNGRLM